MNEEKYRDMRERLEDKSHSREEIGRIQLLEGLALTTAGLIASVYFLISGGEGVTRTVGIGGYNYFLSDRNK